MRASLRSLTLLVLALVCCPDAAGKDSNKIAGCITDGKGRPVANAKAQAHGERQIGFWSRTTLSARSDSSRGCFEISVPDGNYAMAVQDSRFFPGEEPRQGTVRVFSGDTARIDLTTKIPDPRLFPAGLSAALSNAHTGFEAQREFQLTQETAVEYGGVPGWYAGHLISGFRTCVVIYSNDEKGHASTYWCKLKWISKLEDAKDLFRGFQSGISGTVTKLAAMGYGNLSEGPCQSKGCLQETDWTSVAGADLSLVLAQDRVWGRSTYEVNLWMTYNREVAQARASSLNASLTPVSIPTPHPDLTSGPAGTRLEAPSAGEALTAPLRRVMSSAAEDPPFDSISAKEAGEGSTPHKALVSLPGLGSCSVRELANGRRYFGCVVTHSDEEHARAAYQELVQVILELGDMTRSPGAARSEAVEGVQLHTDRFRGVDVSIDIDRGFRLTLVILPARAPQ